MKKILSIFMLLLSVSLVSCEKEGGENEDQMPVIKGVVMSADHIRIVSNGLDKATFKVTDDGVDVTELSTIYKLGEDEALEGNTFNSSLTGEYTFYAVYKEGKTNEVVVTAGPAVPAVPADSKPSSKAFVGKAMIVQFTGTQCQFCPYAIAAIDTVMADDDYNSKMEHVAIHSYDQTDPYFSVACESFAKSFELLGHPTIMVNMDGSTKVNSLSESEYLSSVKSFIDNANTASPTVGICAATSIVGNILSANVQIKAAKKGDYHVGMFLIENGLVAMQESRMSAASEIEHLNVFRRVSFRATPDDFSGSPVGFVAAGKYGSVILDVNLDSSWKLENCHLMIYVTAPNADGKYIVQNVVRCEIEDSVAYQYK